MGQRRIRTFGLGPRFQRRRLRIPVGQRIDELAGILLLDLGRNGVNESQKRSRMCPAFLFLYAAAVGALAPAFAIVLRHGEDGDFRVLLDPAEHGFRTDAQHIRIAQA